MKPVSEMRKKPFKVVNQLTGEVHRFSEESSAQMAALNIEKQTKVATHVTISAQDDSDFVRPKEENLVKLITKHTLKAQAEARLDELQRIDWHTGDGGYYHVKKSIAELEQQLAELEKEEKI